MKRRIESFFQGRYGGDEFSIFLLALSIVMVILGRILASRFMLILGYMPLIYSSIRIFSKDINTRMAENYKFKLAIRPLEKKFNIMKMRFRDRKKYKYIKCPNCKTYVRLPRNKGRLKIRCRKCGHEFEGRT